MLIKKIKSKFGEEQLLNLTPITIKVFLEYKNTRLVIMW